MTTARAPLVERTSEVPTGAIAGMDARWGHAIARNAAMNPAPGDRSIRATACGSRDRGMRPRVACMRAGAVCVPTQSLRLLQRMPRLGEHQCSRDGDGTFGKWLIELGRTDVLLIERWHARVGDVAVADAKIGRASGRERVL